MSLDLSALDLEEDKTGHASGAPLYVPFSMVYEDPTNPRTEFSADELRELATDIAQHGILQPIVVWPLDADGYKIRYGAKRRRAAELAAKTTGIVTVPVVINERPDLDDYAQVAENLKRSGLTPMDFARFLQRKIGTGESKATIAKRLGVSAARVTEHLALLELPAELAAVYAEGRCTSAQLLYQLLTLYRKDARAVKEFLALNGEITRSTIATLTDPLLGVSSNAGASLPTEEGRTKGKAAKAGQRRQEPNTAGLERRLQEYFGARIGIAHNPGTGRGRVVFRYTSLDELDGLLERWRVPSE